jgi:hypothetical protein
VPVPALIATALLVVLMAPVTVREVLPLVRLKPPGAVIAPRLARALVWVLSVSAEVPPVRVAVRVSAVIAPDWVRAPPPVRVTVLVVWAAARSTPVASR